MTWSAVLKSSTEDQTRSLICRLPWIGNAEDQLYEEDVCRTLLFSLSVAGTLLVQSCS
jgi:hypothetical protein